MKQAIQAALRPVRVRQQALFTLRCVAAGLMASAAVGLAAAALLWPISPREAEAGPAPAPEHVLAVAREQKEKLQALEKKLADTAQDMDDEKADEEKKGIKELLEKLMQKVEEMT